MSSCQLLCHHVNCDVVIMSVVMFSFSMSVVGCEVGCNVSCDVGHDVGCDVVISVLMP